MFRIHMLPAEDGDCFLIETGKDPHRILVDGGRRGTAGRFLRETIDSLPRREGPLINLMILTHIDADHIEGLLTLIEDGGDLAVGEVWFNGLDHVRIAAGQKPPRRPRLRDIRRKPLPVLSIKQANDFADVLEARGWPWNTSLNRGVAMVEPNGGLPAVPLPGDALLTLLGPPRAKLGAFVKDWELWFGMLGKPTKPVLSAKQAARVLTPDDVEQLASLSDYPDTAKPNGTSITFVIEYRGKRALFCADAHPGDLATALKRYANTARIRFDAVKVAHHGSAANNTSALIDTLESEIWLVSSNGVRHHHPEPEAIARIVHAPAPNKRLIFNYSTPFSQLWANRELATHFRYRPEYANGNSAVIIDLI